MASAHASETATQDQAADHSHQTHHVRREPFELDITEAPPTPDQLKSISEYVSESRTAQLVSGAISRADAMSKLKQNPESFVRPVVSDVS